MASNIQPPETRIKELVDCYGQSEGICLAKLLCDRHEPGATAFRLMRGTVPYDFSYGELKNLSERAAAAMVTHGLGPGAREATLMGKGRELLATLLAIWRIGAVHVPLFTAFASEGIAYRLAGCAADAVFCDAGQKRKLDGQAIAMSGKKTLLVTLGEAADDDEAITWSAFVSNNGPAPKRHLSRPDDPMVCIFTSGTTGNPKGVDLPVKGLASIHAYAEFGLGITQDDIYWCAADPGWAYGLYYAVIAPLLLGHPAIILEGGFDAETTYRVLVEQHVTNFAAAPTVYRALRAKDVVEPGVLAIPKLSSAGEPLTADLNDWAPAALGSLIHDHFGQTEAGMIVNNHHHGALCEMPNAGCMGTAMPGWQVGILHEQTFQPIKSGQPGLLAVDTWNSPLAWFGGYLNDAEGTASKFSPDGRWYFTGDTATMDTEGRIYFSARADDVILMAGYRIGPFEIESTLNEHPMVMKSAAVGVPDSISGERLEAFVVLNEGSEASEELKCDLQAWVKQRYAAHAYPRNIHFVSDLPTTPSGKVQRSKLRNSLV